MQFAQTSQIVLSDVNGCFPIHHFDPGRVCILYGNKDYLGAAVPELREQTQQGFRSVLEHTSSFRWHELR